MSASISLSYNFQSITEGEPGDLEVSQPNSSLCEDEVLLRCEYELIHLEVPVVAIQNEFVDRLNIPGREETGAVRRSFDAMLEDHLLEIIIAFLYISCPLVEVAILYSHSSVLC